MLLRSAIEHNVTSALYKYVLLLCLLLLIKIQNTIIRIITNSHFLASTEKLYNETGILPFGYVCEI